MVPLGNREGERNNDARARRPACYFVPSDSTGDRGCTELVDSMSLKKDNPDEKLTEKEKKLVRILRGIDYGEVKIIVQGNQPVRIEELTKSIKL